MARVEYSECGKKYEWRSDRNDWLLATGGATLLLAGLPWFIIPLAAYEAYRILDQRFEAHEDNVILRK